MKMMGSLILMIWVIAALNGDLKDAPKRGELREEPAVCRVEVKDCVVTDRNLKVIFSVTNTSPNDIWVCEDVHVDEKYGRGKNVATRIVDGTLCIKRRFKLRSESLIAYSIWARYRRLPPGQSFSDTIARTLPIRDASPVESFRVVRGRPTPVDIDRVVLDVGYFTKDVAEAFARNADLTMATTITSSSRKEDTVDPNRIDWSVFLDLITRKPGAREPNEEELARIRNHMRKSSPSVRPVAGDPDAIDIPHLWGDLHREESVRVTVENVSVPCIAIIQKDKRPPAKETKRH